MKTPPTIQFKKNQRRRGGALLVAVMFFAVTAVFLATYLYLCKDEYTSVARSQTWNTSMVMAEAGVEDALAFLNQNANGAVGTLGNWPATASANGWNTVTNSNPTVYYVSGRSPDSSMGSYTVYITNNATATNGPTIVSIGTSRWNGNMATLKASNPTRKILVETAGMSQGSKGIIAYSQMDFKGNNVTMDSFDSADPNHSIWQTTMKYHGTNYGLFSDSGLSYSSNSLPSRTANVMVATDGTIIDVNNANIYGFVNTAPGGSASINKNGSVGDLNWVHAPTTGVEPGHERDDMNQIFYSKALPNPATNGWQTTWLPLPNPANGTYFKIGGTWTNIAGIGWTNVGGTQYQYGGGGVSLPSPDGSGSETYTAIITNMPANSNWVFYTVDQLSQNIFVDAPYVVLYCTNGIKFSGQSYFTINSNADITIYTTGNIDDGGKAVFDNGANYAKSFSIYDVAGYPNLSFSFTGNGIGSGYIYAPSTGMNFGGNGGTYGFVGCLFCNNIQINGNYTFHFDEVFDQTTAPDQYLPTMWQEVQ